MADANAFVIVNGIVSIVTDPMGFIIFNGNGLIFLSANIKQFLAFFVLEEDLIEILFRSLQTAARFDAALCFVVRKFVGRHVFGVVDTPDNNGLVGIAFLERDNDFLANPG